MAARCVRPRYGRHPRLAIWGPLEARLQQADLLVLGGLNEGTWPAEAGGRSLAQPPDAARSSACRRRSGASASRRMTSPRRCGAPQVVLTRALRVEGTPTVPSRWLLRLDGLLRSHRHRARTSARWRPLARLAGEARPAGRRSEPMAPPTPLPAGRGAAAPAVGDGDRDLAARSLRHLCPAHPEAEAARSPRCGDRARPTAAPVIHQALDALRRADFRGRCPPMRSAQLLAIGEHGFGPLLTRPALWAFWWPRFERIAALVRRRGARAPRRACSRSTPRSRADCEIDDARRASSR